MILIIKKSFIISLFIVFLLVPYNSYSDDSVIDDYGIVTLMYHRFNENQYPSTNIRMQDFIKQIEIIKKQNIIFVNPVDFNKNLIHLKNKKKILITIDDAFLSFYQNAWPLLKKNKIPFILFVSTREVGKFGYMSWDQIREVSRENFTYIGNHSHSHEYLIDENDDFITKDLLKSISILKKELNLNPDFFSYPFGEYSLNFKKIVRANGFEFAFGQHSGVIDETKDMLELPRFPINEKYGELKRFKTLVKTLPLKYKSIIPEEKYINQETNPPAVKIKFFKNMYNIKSINCFSNEENKWRASKIDFINEDEIEIKLSGKFTTERGRINCSLRESNGSYRWLGMQFVILEK